MWTPNPVRIHLKKKKTKTKNYDTMYQTKITFSHFNHLHLVSHWLRVTIPKNDHKILSQKKRENAHQNKMWVFLWGTMRLIYNLWSWRGKNLVSPKWLCWYKSHKPKVVEPSNLHQKLMAEPQTWPQAQSPM